VVSGSVQAWMGSTAIVMAKSSGGGEPAWSRNRHDAVC
jgi:hypothetical protein